MYCTVLYCAIHYCTEQCCTVLYCTGLYCNVLYCSVLCYTLLHWTLLYCTVLYWTVLYCTVMYCTVLYCTFLYYTERWLVFFVTGHSLSMLSYLYFQHEMAAFPPTEQRQYPQRKCKVCLKSGGVRKDTRYYCVSCNVPLCKFKCFRVSVIIWKQNFLFMSLWYLWPLPSCCSVVLEG
jgi:hypothetical protein